MAKPKTPAPKKKTARKAAVPAPVDTPLTVPYNELVFDPALQMRDGDVDQAHTQNLADILREDDGAELTPLTVFVAAEGDPAYLGVDLPRYYVADGFHRGGAYRLARGEGARVPVTAPGGGRAAALLYAYGANDGQNTKPRTRKDIRKAVKVALLNHYFAAAEKLQCNKVSKLPNSQRFSFEHIAEICRCDKSTVSRIAKDLEAELTPAAPAPAKRSGRTSGGAGAVREQLDFWAKLRGEFSTALAAVHEIRDDQEFLIAVDGDPLRAAEEIRELRRVLVEEIRELKKREESIRASAAKAQR